MDGFIDLWKYSELPDYILFLSSSTLTCKKSNLKKKSSFSYKKAQNIELWHRKSPQTGILMSNFALKLAKG